MDAAVTPVIVSGFFPMLTATLAGAVSLWFASPITRYHTVYAPASVPVGMSWLYVPFSVRLYCIVP